MSNPQLPLSKEELEAVVHERALDSKNIDFTFHCLIRLEERDVTTIEAIRCLRRGHIVGDVEYSEEHNTWKFRIQEPPPRDIVCLVAAVSLDPASREVTAITVWEV